MDRNLRRLVYRSRAVARFRREEVDALLHHARHNNAIDGISGLLWSDGDVFVQTLEGPPDSVEETFARIREDTRHRDVEVLSDEPACIRCFGTWYMAGAGLTGGPSDPDSLAFAVRNAPEAVKRCYPPSATD